MTANLNSWRRTLVQTRAMFCGTPLDRSSAASRVRARLPHQCNPRPHRLTSLHSMDIVRREQRKAFITADGSSIRELAGTPSGNAGNQSLAEAVVPPGSATIAHFHHRSEEIYLFTHGSGRVRPSGRARVISLRPNPRSKSPIAKSQT